MVKCTAKILVIILVSAPTLFPFEKKEKSTPLQPLQKYYELRKNSLEKSLLKILPSYNLKARVLLNEIPPKSKGRAFLQSLIIPGWGQYYAESKTMFKVFLTSEILLWGSFIGFNVWSNWLENDFKNFAAEHAGIDPKGKPARYFVDIGNFDSISEFNQAQLRDRDVNDLYPDTDEFFWQWDSPENRNKYENIRIRRDRAENRADFTLAAIFVNHVISAIHSTWAVHKFNKRLNKAGLGYQIYIDLQEPTPTLKINFVKNF